MKSAQPTAWERSSNSHTVRANTSSDTPGFHAASEVLGDVDWSSNELETTRRDYEPDAELDAEPRVAHALRVEERAMRHR